MLTAKIYVTIDEHLRGEKEGKKERQKGTIIIIWQVNEIKYITLGYDICAIDQCKKQVSVVVIQVVHMYFKEGSLPLRQVEKQQIVKKH